MKKIQRVASWRPICTAPTKERKPIWLKVPGREPAAAYSDTFWISGFSVECKPTHWKLRTDATNKHADAISELMKQLDAITSVIQREESPRLNAHYRLNAAWIALNEARRLLLPP